MFVIIGAIVVLAGVIGGYLMEKGNLSVLFQPAELVIIYGAAIGGFLVANPPKLISMTISQIIKLLSHKTYSKEDYQELLLLLNGLFYKIRQQGLISVESDVDDVKNSPLFNNYPKVLKNHHAITFICDTLRTIMTTTLEAHELDTLMESELEAHHEEMMAPSKSVNTVADSLPGLGIVAAVLGVVLTMGKMGEPPEVLGHSIGAALVGTFLGVLSCYGFVGPISKNMEHLAEEQLRYLTVVKVGLLSFIGGAAPKVAIEFSRRVIPDSARPSFAEVEELLRTKK
jgi:chemotaxis protein MotA